MTLAALSLLASAADPSVTLTWRRDDAVIQVYAPVGEHLSPDAPFSVSLLWDGGSFTRGGLGSALTDGVPVPDLRGRGITGAVSASICDDANTRCVLGSWSIEGVVGAEKKGVLALSVGTTREEHGLGGIGTDADVAANAALARARGDGSLVLLDFGAVWCPPCNVLAAEVLSDPALTEGFVLATLDVDDRSSFPWKDRFAVGGYPTVVATDADGRELSRVVGYPGRAAFLDWLGEVRSGAAVLPAEPDAVDGRRAAEVAWSLVQQGKEDAAAAWLARSEDGAPLRLARFSMTPGVEDLRWLVASDASVGDFVFGAFDLTIDDALKAELVARVVDALAAGEGPTPASDLAWALGVLTDDPAWYAAAASLLRAQLTGDPVHDKGHQSEIISALQEAGRKDEALSLARRQASLFPDEMTFHLAEAQVALALDRPEEALAAAQRGLPVSRDDNRLRVATVAARALVALGRVDDARALVAATLTELPEPAGLAVRTFRYRKALAAVVEAPPVP